MQLLCPLCSAPLSANETNSALGCDSGHSFDRARQGYWNLLPVQRKRSKDPGDNPEMVSARERFLKQGFYQPVSEVLNQLAAQTLPESNPRQPAGVIDLGCGEGYYTAALDQHLKRAAITADIVGLDISKHAIKSACRKERSISWLVASSAAVPLGQQSIDLAIIVFSRVLSEPLQQVIKARGKVILAYPGPEHLRSLRTLIYDSVQDKPFNAKQQLGPNFELIEQQRVNYDISLDNPLQISDLLAMTPHGQRIRAGKREQIIAHQKLDTRVDIQLAVFQHLAKIESNEPDD